MFPHARTTQKSLRADKQRPAATLMLYLGWSELRRRQGWVRMGSVAVNESKGALKACALYR